MRPCSRSSRARSRRRVSKPRRPSSTAWSMPTRRNTATSTSRRSGPGMREKQANRRIRLLLVIFVLIFAATLARAVWLQGVRAASLSKLAEHQHREVVTIPADRGTIYDRTGVQLAIGEQMTTLYADPRQVTNP